jgi:hypothetical protein
VVLFIAIGLLAPYAGCHIFTSSPRDRHENSEESAVESSGRNKHNDFGKNLQGKDAEEARIEPAPAQLDELQELLSQ